MPIIDSTSIYGLSFLLLISFIYINLRSRRNVKPKVTCIQPIVKTCNYVDKLVVDDTQLDDNIRAPQAQANAELSTYLPEFNCFQTNTYWPGQPEKKAWIVIEQPILSSIFASGTSELEAVQNAIKRCKSEKSC